MWGQSAWVGGQRGRAQVQPRRWTGTWHRGRAGSSEIWPDGVRDLKRWLMWEIVCSGTCQDVSATMCGQASWANGACGPGPAPLFVVKCDRSQRLVAHSRLHSE